LAKAGVTVAASATCSSMKLPHREWKATYNMFTSSTYVSVATKTHILVLVVARTLGTSAGTADSKLRSACASLKV
jgi:hypothetical protein